VRGEKNREINRKNILWKYLWFRCRIRKLDHWRQQRCKWWQRRVWSYRRSPWEKKHGRRMPQRPFFGGPVFFFSVYFTASTQLDNC